MLAGEQNQTFRARKIRQPVDVAVEMVWRSVPGGVRNGGRRHLPVVEPTDNALGRVWAEPDVELVLFHACILAHAASDSKEPACPQNPLCTLWVCKIRHYDSTFAEWQYSTRKHLSDFARPTLSDFAHPPTLRCGPNLHKGDKCLKHANAGWGGLMMQLRCGLRLSQSIPVVTEGSFRSTPDRRGGCG